MTAFVTTVGLMSLALQARSVLLAVRLFVEGARS